MDSHSDAYKGDGRIVEMIGDALGLNQMAIQQVQQEADRPDKVAMNIWRMICPTRQDRVFVGSIKHVPKSTIENIYSKSISFIDILNRISHSFFSLM
jgi:hypothetical protein